MRGKYKQKRLRKKYRDQLGHFKNNPNKVIEEYCGLKLYWYQKLFLKKMLKKGK